MPASHHNSHGSTRDDPRLRQLSLKISYDSFQGASFPVDTATNSATAKSDCDPNGVGTQFIFGGASHVYVADGSWYESTVSGRPRTSSSS